MARWLVRKIAEEQGFNPHSLAIEAKLAYNTVRPIWQGKAKRVDLDTLSQLARVLKVAPGDLIANGDGDAEVIEGILTPVQANGWTPALVPALG